MILYHVVDWMTERKRLSHMIRFVDGDVQFLIEKKRKLDAAMFTQLEQWNRNEGSVILHDLAEPPPVTASLMLTR